MCSSIKKSSNIWRIYDNLAPGSWGNLYDLRLKTKVIQRHLIENTDKIEVLLKCLEIKLLITNFNRHIIINNHL